MPPLTMNKFDTPCQSEVGQSLVASAVGESVRCPKPVRLMIMLYSSNAAWNQQTWNNQIGQLAIAAKEYIKLAPGQGFDQEWEMVIIWFGLVLTGFGFVHDNPNPDQENIDDPDLDFNELDPVILERLTIVQQPDFGTSQPWTPSNPQTYVDYVHAAADGRPVEQLVFVVESGGLDGVEGLNRHGNAFEEALDMIAETFGLIRPLKAFPQIPFIQSLDVLERGAFIDLLRPRWAHHFTEVLFCWFPIQTIGLPPPGFLKCQFEEP